MEVIPLEEGSSQEALMDNNGDKETTVKVTDEEAEDRDLQEHEVEPRSGRTKRAIITAPPQPRDGNRPRYRRDTRGRWRQVLT